MKKNILLIIFMLLILPKLFSEILVQTTQSPVGEHQFIVNKYYFQQAAPIITEKNSAILIQTNVTEQTISQCSQTEFSFNLANPTLKTQTYSISVKDFEGTVYLSPNVIIPSKEIRKINLILMPDCKFSGTLNPKIVVETDKETAELSLLLNVLPVKFETITQKDCLFYYNESVCNSNNYIRFYQGTKYILNLDEMFFDPDEDKLEYSADAFNLVVKIKNGKAIITPLNDFYGSEQVVFYADDLKGGKAQSQTFYFHVLSNGKSSFENFILLNLPMVLGFIILVFIFLLIIAFLISPLGKNKSKDADINNEDIPEPPKKNNRVREIRKK